jgi:hypothetical protein
MREIIGHASCVLTAFIWFAGGGARAAEANAK